MARKTPRPQPTERQDLEPVLHHCPHCGCLMWFAYTKRRTVTTMEAVRRLRIVVRHCVNPTCAAYHRPYHPEEEGSLVLPQHEFGLDVMAFVGALRYGAHRSVPEIHAALRARGVLVSERTVTNLLDRYDELVTVSLSDRARLHEHLAQQGRLVLALDGLQPDVGHEVLWVLREVISGEILLARSLLSSCAEDLKALIEEALAGLAVPVVGVISDGDQSIRKAVAESLPTVPHQLCPYHYLRHAAEAFYAADRAAKTKLKKAVRGIRPIERAVEQQRGAQADPESEGRPTRPSAEMEAILGYAAAVRSALTDDGRPPLEASGLKLHGRLSAIAESLDDVGEKGGSLRS